jgi:hypothetical protein
MAMAGPAIKRNRLARLQGDSDLSNRKIDSESLFSRVPLNLGAILHFIW